MLSIFHIVFVFVFSVAIFLKVYKCERKLSKFVGKIKPAFPEKTFDFSSETKDRGDQRLCHMSGQKKSRVNNTFNTLLTRHFVPNPNGLKLLGKLSFLHHQWRLWWQLLLIFHSDLHFLSANPTLYGLVIKQRPIFGPEGASWNIFGLFPHYSLKIWKETRWR